MGYEGVGHTAFQVKEVFRVAEGMMAAAYCGLAVGRRAETVMITDGASSKYR